MTTCLNCKKETTNPKFCTRSCAASYNNKFFIKRTKKWRCIICNAPVKEQRMYCPECQVKGKDHKLSTIIYQKHHRSSMFALVRGRAKTIVSSLPQICSKCGYSKHVEVCHIKPISSFPEDTRLSIINDPSNLILLCPNCHWEFDNDQKQKELLFPLSYEGKKSLGNG